MKVRIGAVLVILTLACTALAPAVALAGSEQEFPARMEFAQEVGEGQEDPAGQEEEAEGQESQSDEANTAEESGADQSETESAAEEVGPPWTYQMARLGLLLIVLLALGIGFWYWRLIARRQRSGI